MFAVDPSAYPSPHQNEMKTLFLLHQTGDCLRQDLQAIHQSHLCCATLRTGQHDESFVVQTTLLNHREHFV